MKVSIRCKGSHTALLSDLKIIQGDLKQLSDKSYNKLKQQILDEGFIAPFFVWINDGELNLLDGTQRKLTLVKMSEEGIELPDQFPIVQVEADSYKQACKRILALSSQYGSMTKDGLKDFMDRAEISFEEVEEEFEFDAIDFDEFKDEFKDSESGESDPRDDETPEVEENTYVMDGDLWTLGEHRVLCGDSTIKENVDRVLAGDKIDMVFTSPPYSDLRDYNKEIVDLSIKKLSKIFDIPASTFYINLGLKIKDRSIDRYWDEWILEAINRGHKLLAWLIWDKGNASSPAHQQSMFGISHEWIIVFGKYKKQNLIKKNKGTETWGIHTIREKDGSTKQTALGEKRTHRQLDTVFQLNKAVTAFSGIKHPAQFPISLPELFINSHTKENENICEPFLGSGTTLIACEKTNRKCYGMEIDPQYVQVIIERYKTYMQKENKDYSISCERGGQTYSLDQIKSMI